MENDLLTSDKEQLKMYFDSLEVNKVIEPAPIDDNEAEIEEYVDQIIADFTTGNGGWVCSSPTRTGIHRRTM